MELLLTSGLSDMLLDCAERAFYAINEIVVQQIELDIDGA
jgi:hypothetical protein